MAVMAWFKKERKPRTAPRERREIPADAWEKCESCGHVDIREKFVRALNVCPECGTHKRFAAELKAGSSDAIYTGLGRLEAEPVHLGVMNFRFMGGSMGSVVGEKIARLARRSAEKKIPMILVCTSGGARMQEGALSLMQMAKTSAAIAQMRARGVPYIAILTDPTTGGVSASFAMQGDVILAEPGAVIGFAGQRVIKQTIGQDLPEGFQTAEFLLEKGQIDDVVPRASLRETTARLLRHMRGRRAPAGADAAA